MASISAELRVGGHVFPLLRFTYEVHQSTDRRGRVVTKVRYGLVQMLLDVPRTDFLKAWAADPVKRWSVDLVSLDATSGQATETLHLDGAYCVFYRERFQKGDIHTGSFTLELHLSDPDGFTITPGGPAAYVAPAARDHGAPPVATALGGAAPDPHAAAWAAARAQALGPAAVAALYAAYQARKQGTGRDQAAWWNGNNNRGGAKRTVEGGLGEYQADKLFAAQGHGKLNHDGALVGLGHPPKGKGLDGVWRNAAPPPDYLITETKYDSAKLAKGQMSDDWVRKNLAKSVGEEEGLRIERAMDKGQVGKLLLHVDTDGKLHEHPVDEFGKIQKN